MKETRSSEDAAGQQQIVRAAGVVSAGVLLSRVSGLLRETVMAHLFGAGRVYDAFSLGFRIPNLTRDLFAEGALSSAFVPTFTEYLATKGRKEAAELSNLVGTAVILIVGAVCVLGTVFSPALVGLLAPGWAAADPGKFELAISMTRIMFPFLLVVALAAQAMGILNACGRFAVPTLASTFFNVGSVAFGVALGFWLGPHLGITPIAGMAWGVVLGGTLQLLWQLPSLRRLGFRFRLRLDWSHPGLRHIIYLMGPAIIGSAAVQVNVAVNTNLASTIVDPLRGVNGPVSWLQFAFRFMQLPLGLFGVAIASAMLPSISRSAASGNLEEFRKTVSRSVGMVLLLTVPSSVGLDHSRQFDDRADLPGPQVRGLRYASDRRGAGLLRHRAGRLRRGEDTGAGLLCPRQRAGADAGEPRLHPDQLPGGVVDDASHGAGTRGAGAGDLGRVAVRLGGSVLDPEGANGRNSRPRFVAQHAEDRLGLRGDGEE